MCSAAPTSPLPSPLDSCHQWSWHVSGVLARADVDFWAPLTLFLPTAWHFADFWLICTFSGHGQSGEQNPEMYSFAFVSSFCRVREAELSRNTVCSLGLRLFFPLNLPLPHLSPLVQRGGDCLRYRHVWSRDTWWFRQAGSAFQVTV